MGAVLLCARLGRMAVSAYHSQTRSVSTYRRPERLLKSRMCERHSSGSVRAGAATFGEHPVYSTCALCCGSLLPRHLIAKLQAFPQSEYSRPVLRAYENFVHIRSQKSEVRSKNVLVRGPSWNPSSWLALREKIHQINGQEVTESEGATELIFGFLSVFVSWWWLLFLRAKPPRRGETLTC
jgi:hypothetical protein